MRPVLEAGAVRIDARDVRVRVRRHADVARRADVEVELAVGTEGQVLPAVRRVLRQRVVHDLHLRRAVELALDAFHLRDAVDLGDVERAVLERHAVRQVETLGDGLHLARAALVDDRVDAARDPAGDEQRAAITPGHRARVVDAVCPQLDLEARRHLDLVHGDLARRLRRRRLRDRRQRRALHVLRLSLLPRRRRLLGGEGAGGEHEGHDDGERQRKPERAKPHDGSSGAADGWLGWMAPDRSARATPCQRRRGVSGPASSTGGAAGLDAALGASRQNVQPRREAVALGAAPLDDLRHQAQLDTKTSLMRTPSPSPAGLKPGARRPRRAARPPRARLRARAGRAGRRRARDRPAPPRESPRAAARRAA